MTSTPCRSVALDFIIASWAAKIVGFLVTIVETILMIAEKYPQRRAGDSCQSPDGRMAASDAAIGAVSPDEVESWLRAACGKHAPRLQARIKTHLGEPPHRLTTILIPPEFDDAAGSDQGHALT